MAPVLELLFLTIALICGAVALVRWLLLRSARGPHLHEVEARFACPKTASDVDCTLIENTASGQCAGVKRCSRFGDDEIPQCEQHCVKLINLGIGLRAKDDTATLDSDPEASSEGEEDSLHELSV